MGRYRSISGTIAQIKADDPETAITESLLRKLIREGYIPSVKSGCKYLVDLDDIYDYFYVKKGRKK
ncbi:MAG: hypothetical protein KBS56_02150 [Clostridiales bacterium]|nr:hypothetical protein [Candidatus Crickella equi]